MLGAIPGGNSVDAVACPFLLHQESGLLRYRGLHERCAGHRIQAGPPSDPNQGHIKFSRLPTDKKQSGPGQVIIRAPTRHPRERTVQRRTDRAPYNKRPAGAITHSRNEDLEVQQRCRRGIAIERLDTPEARGRIVFVIPEDDHQGIVAGPPILTDDLLDDGRDVGRL